MYAHNLSPKLWQKQKSFAISEKDFSRDYSLHTKSPTQRKPLSWTFCSTLTYTMIRLSHCMAMTDIQTLAPLVHHPCQVLERISCTTLGQRNQNMIRTWIPRSSSIPWLVMSQSIPVGHPSMWHAFHYLIGPVTEKLEVLHGAIETMPFQQSGA